MRINSINYNPSFRGIVKMDKKAITEQIYNCPKQNHEDIINSINAIKQGLEAMPDDRYFSIYFNQDFDYPNDLWAPQMCAKITVKDNDTNKCVQGEIQLASNENEHKKNNKNYFSDKETAQKEFIEDIIEQMETPDYSNKDRIGKIKPNEIKMNNEVKEIYDKIEDREDRIKMDKKQIAQSVRRATTRCPYDIKESLIENINLLTKNIEENTSCEKSYEIETRGGFSTNYDAHYYFDMSIKSLDCEKEHFSSGIMLSISSGGGEFECPINSADIRDVMFEPLTQEVLNQGYNHLPFEYNSAKRKIYTKLN